MSWFVFVFILYMFLLLLLLHIQLPLQQLLQLLLSYPVTKLLENCIRNIQVLGSNPAYFSFCVICYSCQMPPMVIIMFQVWPAPLILINSTHLILPCWNQTWGQFNSRIGIDGQFWNWNWLFKKNELELELRNFELELKFPTNFFKSKH